MMVMPFTIFFLCLLESQEKMNRIRLQHILRYVLMLNLKAERMLLSLTLGVCAPSEFLVGTSRLSASCCGGNLGSGSPAPTPYKFHSAVTRDNSAANAASRGFGPEVEFGGELGPTNTQIYKKKQL